MSQVKNLVDAIDNFIKGSKADGIWNAIKASCIMAGWDNLNGALIPLKGTGPTNLNFVSGDYNRKTGLLGNGTTKYLNTNRAANVDPESNVHIAAYVSKLQTNGTVAYLMGSSSAGANDALHFASSNSNTPNNYVFRCREDSGTANTRLNQTVGLFAISRSSTTSYESRHAGTTVAHTITAVGTNLFNIYVFASNEANSTSLPSDARIPFYSIGEALNLALLDTRVSQLVTDFNNIIP